MFAVILALISCFIVNAEDFEKLNPFTPAKKASLEKAGWTVSAECAIPDGWYIGKYNVAKPEYRVEKSDDSKIGRHIFIRGGFAVDATRVRQKQGDEYVIMDFTGKSDARNASVIFYATLMDAKGKYLGQRALSMPIGKDWKKYSLKLKMPAAPAGVKTKITPGFYTSSGIYIDAVTFRSAPASEFVIPAVPAKKGALMDFEFDGIGGRKEFSDRTGNYKVYSDCGNFVDMHDALRVAQGARFRIPCRNEAFGESFTMSAWISKASLGGIFQTPILSRGWHHPGSIMSTVNNEFDFAFYVDIRLPAFATGNGNRGLQTTGYYYNMNISYLRPEYLLTESNKPLALNRWQQVTAVYDRGAVRVYLNGKLIGENKKQTDKKLMTSGLDMYLGGFRCKNERDNKVSAEMLIKSLRVEGRALSSVEVAADFEREKKNFPMDDVYPDLVAIRNYYPEDMMELDPMMQKRLRRTAEFKKNLPPDPVKGKKNITTSLNATPERVTLMINGRNVAKVNGHGHIQDNDHRLGEFVSDFGAAGIDLAGSGTGAVWNGIDKYDWSKLDRRLELYIRNNPRCMIDVSIGTSPPQWYRKQFPEEQEVYLYKGKKGWEKRVWTGHGGFLGSDRYLRDSSKMVRDVIRHIESSPYAAHVYGYLITGGDAGEWYWPGQFSGGHTGYSQPTLKAFRNWLRQKYKNDVTRLRQAWNSAALTFENVEIPMPEERMKADNLLFRDPSKSVPSMDMRCFMQDRNILNINTITREARLAAPGKQITTYYGYSLLYLCNPMLGFSGLQTVSDILRSPYIDWIATPIDYVRRRGGDAGVNIAGFLGSSSLHGKGIWREEDLRTHLFTRLEHGRTGSLRETNEVIRRAYSYTIAEDYGMWYICQFGLHGYHHNGIMDDSAKMKKIADHAAANPGKNIAEVALIFDEKDSASHIAPLRFWRFVEDSGFAFFRRAHSMGTPFKLYFMNDIDNPAMPDYKLYIFMNPWSVNAEQRAKIHAKLRKNNAVAYWNYAPGYIDGKKFNLQNMKDLTGFDFTEERTIKNFKINFTGNNIFSTVKPFKSFEIGPVFSVKNSPETQVIGKNGNYNLAATKKCDGFTSVWSMLPASREMLTALCRFAKVHVYTDNDSVLLANDRYIAVHSAGIDAVKIELPQKAFVHDMINGMDIGEKKSFVFKPEYKGQTAIFELKK